MLDIAWSEMLVIALVALIVIGPKDLPKLVREVGKWTAKARGMAREFQRSFDDMVRESELEEIKKGIDMARPGGIERTIRDAVDPDRSLERALDMRDDPAVEASGKASMTPSSAAPPPAPAVAYDPVAAAIGGAQAEAASGDIDRPIAAREAERPTSPAQG